MPAAVKSAFDVAFWFADTALHDNEYMQPQKLQRLLFLSECKERGVQVITLQEPPAMCGEPSLMG